MKIYRITIRISEGQYKEVNKLVSENPDRWANNAHFFRSAIIRQVRQFREGEIR